MSCGTWRPRRRGGGGGRGPGGQGACRPDGLDKEKEEDAFGVGGVLNTLQCLMKHERNSLLIAGHFHLSAVPAA